MSESDDSEKETGTCDHCDGEFSWSGLYSPEPQNEFYCARCLIGALRKNLTKKTLIRIVNETKGVK